MSRRTCVVRHRRARGAPGHLRMLDAGTERFKHQGAGVARGLQKAAEGDVWLWALGSSPPTSPADRARDCARALQLEIFFLFKIKWRVCGERRVRVRQSQRAVSESACLYRLYTALCLCV
jgi:hypothetical protein